MTLSSLFVSAFQYIWFGVGVFLAVIIIGAFVLFLYNEIKGFGKYTHETITRPTIKPPKIKKKDDDKDE